MQEGSGQTEGIGFWRLQGEEMEGKLVGIGKAGERESIQLHYRIYAGNNSSYTTTQVYLTPINAVPDQQQHRQLKEKTFQNIISQKNPNPPSQTQPNPSPNDPLLASLLIPQDLFFQIQQFIDMRIKDTSLVYSYSISVCMGSFVFGYELTSFGNLNDLIIAANTWKDQQEIDQTLLLLSSVLSLAAIFGVGVHRYLIRTFGWIQTFKITDYLTILAAFVGVLNLSVGAQAFSRIIFGVVTGINTILIPTYLTSVLPGAMGGPAGTLNQLFITIGIFFGFWMGYIVVGEASSDMGWRVITGLPIIPALVRLHTSQNVYPYETVESMIENEQDEALERYVTMMYQEVSVEEFKEAKRLPEIDIEAEKATFFDPIAESHKRRLFMASGIVFFNQLSGGAALGNFGGNVSFLSVAGEDKESILSVFVYLNLLQVIVTLFSGQFLEKYGRRAFMMQGQRVIIVSLLLVAFIEIFVPQLHIFTVILTFIQMVGFSLSYGPCSFLIGTQILHDIFYPSVLLWVFIFIHGISVGTFIQSIGVGPLCLIYCAFQVWGFLYISGYLVETQGRSRRDVYEDFRKGIFPNPIRYLREKLNNTAKQQQRDIELPLVDRTPHS